MIIVLGEQWTPRGEIEGACQLKEGSIQFKRGEIEILEEKSNPNKVSSAFMPHSSVQVQKEEKLSCLVPHLPCSALQRRRRRRKMKKERREKMAGKKE